MQLPQIAVQMEFLAGTGLIASKFREIAYAKHKIVGK